jgi:hypothetical protein
MARSTIYVQYSDGTPCRGARVALGFDRFFSGGVTNHVLTDRAGEAVVEHANTGRATIYVNGRDRGTIHTPGRASITL